MCRRRSERIGRILDPASLCGGRLVGGGVGFGSINSTVSQNATRGHHHAVCGRLRESGVFGAIGGEFDPGSGSTLAACLMHASRARASSEVLRGGRVRNTWATCPGVGDSRGKPRVIPHTCISRTAGCRKGAIPPWE